jgi:hypothetical protein
VRKDAKKRGLQSVPERRLIDLAAVTEESYCKRCHLRLDKVLNRIQIFNGQMCLGCAEYVVAVWIEKHPAGL